MGNDTKPYSIVTGKGYLVIKLEGMCDCSNLKPFEQEFDQYLNSDCPHLIINCENLVFLSNDWLRSFMKTQNLIKNNKKGLRLVGVPAPVKQQMKKDGMDEVFKFANNLKEALGDFGIIVKKGLDTEFINPFLTATLKVLEVQAGVKAQSGKPYLKDDDHKLSGDVSGIIAIVSDSFNGSVVISFPEKTFLQIMSSMLGETYTELNKEIIDGAGEITNMIFGQAKITLNEKGHGIKMAIPSVVSGKDHSLSSLAKGPIVVLPFTGSAGDFFVEIFLNE